MARGRDWARGEETRRDETRREEKEREEKRVERRGEKTALDHRTSKRSSAVSADKDRQDDVQDGRLLEHSSLLDALSLHSFSLQHTEKTRTLAREGARGILIYTPSEPIYAHCPVWRVLFLLPRRAAPRRAE